jgi:DNA repair exonuclease SbcCD ATPase subunit
LRIVHVRSALVPLLSAAVVVGGIVMVRQSVHLAAYERQHAEDARELGQLRAAVRAEQARNPAAPASPLEVRAPVSPSRRGAPDTSELAARDAAIQQLNRELAEAHAGIARLQAQLQNSFQEKQEAVETAAEDFQKRERVWRDQIESFKQQLDSARAETQAARERAASLEADNAKIKSENGAGSARAADLRKAMAALQDLDRRRDAYLGSTIRRYREITDQFRAMTATLDSGHGVESASFNGIALSRIQNAISLAEDDMRRLNELNAQARQIEGRLAKN